MASKREQAFVAQPETRVLMRVRFFETDLMGIVHHANYLKYAEAGRVEYLRRRGVDYRRFLEGGLYMPVVEAHMRYRKAARFDDELCVVVSLGQLTRVTVRFDYRIVDAVGSALIAEGHTLLACVDDAHRPRRIPEDVARMLQQPEQTKCVSSK